MEGRFAGRVVIVTGGASGIGAATARAFAAEGARVVIADVDRERGREVAGATAGVFEAVDVGDGAAVRALVEQTVAAFRRVDVLVSTPSRPAAARSSASPSTPGRARSR